MERKPACSSGANPGARRGERAGRTGYMEKDLTSGSVLKGRVNGQIAADVNKPTADQMSELLMKEREAATMNVASARHSR